MLIRSPSFDKLVHELSKLPGVGPKTAQRLAYYLLRRSDGQVDLLKEALSQVQANIHQCPNCFSFTEEPKWCFLCTDPGRQDDVVCVVEDPSDIARIDASGVFRGRYHVLHGSLSPLDGIGPEDLKIQALIDRIKDGQNETGPKICEAILALGADLEGDTTVLYLAKKLGELNVRVTRIAHGVPIGGEIDFIDHRTLGRAIENRIQL